MIWERIYCICFVFPLTFHVFFYDFQVDMTALKQMRDNDLKELGIPMVSSFVSVHMIVCACKMFSCELAF